MPSPPPSARPSSASAACLLLVAAFAAVAVASAGTVGTDSGAAATPVECDGEYYEPSELSVDWTPTYDDGLATGSLPDWSGGRIARVGAVGQCSLVVTENSSATLSAAAVDDPRGVVTGTLDVGANGSLRLVAATGNATDAATASGTTAPTTNATSVGGIDTATATEADASDSPAVVVANRGHDFSTTAVVSVGERSATLTLPSGRFFEFAVVRTDGGGVRVAVWEPGERWDGEWDLRSADARGGDWRVRLQGRAFLDGIAVGTAEAETPTSRAAVDGEPADGETGQTETADQFPGVADPDFDDGSELEGQPDESGGSGGSVFFGLLLIVGGAVGFRYAYELTRFGEQMDAIGSTTRASQVEPADWNVAMSKIVAALTALIGVFLVLTGL